MDFSGHSPLSRRGIMAWGLASRSGLMAQAAAASQPKNSAFRVYNVRDYGARGDGKALDTTALQSAIDSCAANGGGVVLVPPGEFLIGTVELKSNVTLHLSASGRLAGSERIEDYSAGKGVPPGNGNVVLLYAANAENIGIEGPGTIDGHGARFYIGRGDNTGPGQNRAQGYVRRPHLIIFYACKNVRVEDVFLTASAYHCMRILECQFVHFDGIRIHNRVNVNNDGFHFNSCQHVNVSNCDVACQDDACALFGSTKFVTITNCTFSTRWSVFRFGGGEAENIAISNCVIYDTYGCPIKMRCGRGARFESIAFSNLIMKNVTGPISIGLDSKSRRPTAEPDSRAKGVVRNIMFRGIRATVVSEGQQFADMPFKSSFRPGEIRTCITLNGAGDEFLEDVTFDDVHVTFGGGGTADEAARRDIPNMAGEYFELGTLPAYGMYARNVRGLTMCNVRFEVRTPDLRPAVVFDHVDDAAVNSLSAQGNARSGALLRFSETRDTLLTSCRVLTPCPAFLQVEGSGSQGITIEGGDLSKAAAPVSFVEGAERQGVKLRV